MTTGEALNLVYLNLKSGAHESIIKVALMAEKFTPQRADTIILWAKQAIEKDNGTKAI